MEEIDPVIQAFLETQNVKCFAVAWNNFLNYFLNLYYL